MVDGETDRPPPDGGGLQYEIRVEGLLDDHWSGWFDGLQVTGLPTAGVTVIAGRIADQAALHGVLAKVCDLGLPLVSVRRRDPS